MRHLHLLANQPAIGGGEVMLLAMADAAKVLGVPVTVVAPTGETAQAARANGHPVDVIGGRTRQGYLLSLARWRPLPESMTWCVGLLPAVATAGRARRVVHVHQEPQSASQRLAVRSARVGALATVVPSSALASEIPGARVMWNWTGEIPRTATPRGVQGPPRVGFSGRLSTAKGFDMLCAAIGLMDAEHRGGVELVVAGDDRFVPLAQRQAAVDAIRPIAHLVRRLGWVRRERFLGQVDIVAMPSVCLEAFGLVATEAMAAGVPLVVSDAGALPEVVGPGYPWIVPKGDPAALAERLWDVAHRTDDEVVDAARARWEHEFSPRAGTRRFAAVLSGLGVELAPETLP